MFYRIDYERLNRFMGGVCEQNASRCAESDRIDVRSDHTSCTETSPDTSFKQQQTAVVVSVEESGQVDEPDKQGDRPPIPITKEEQEQNEDEGDRSPVSLEESSDGRGDTASAPSSGKDSKLETENFPELAAVAQAVGLEASALPRNLRRAIAQYPEQVEGAIAYLQHQQQKRRIENPVGYLYEAIVSGWVFSTPQSISVLPQGFKEWFDRARIQGVVVAAMVIDGVHHTLHAQRGWIPTMQLMQELPLGVD
ncbi:hypothetical protein [Leptolyngbya sp. FACHB-16]|uniref:hypothetical protein n=1 Tax=unclassified Leptolyngbya TaxID=2650499 RepID=UPI0019BA5E60|nr:hypothetical protein [Leptolyngbya sp. FACHB-16]MBD2153095.1 hypothetical protein [Leptolyngbya sp. FACHB-16]